MENEYFVGIREPREVRKELLETSREVILALKQHETYHNIRKEKIALFEELKKLVDEINYRMNKLKALFPVIETKPAPVVKEVKSKKKAPTKEPSEVDKLEIELNKIEDKLRTL